MLINGRETQERENSTQDSVSTLIEHSTSFHNWEEEDTLISLAALKLLSRPEMVENLKTGGSIKRL